MDFFKLEINTVDGKSHTVYTGENTSSSADLFESHSKFFRCFLDGNPDYYFNIRKEHIVSVVAITKIGESEPEEIIEPTQAKK